MSDRFPGITARFALDNVDAVDATLQLTARMSFWREALANLQKGQPDAYGAWQILGAIRLVIEKAQKDYYERLPEEPR